MYTCIYMLNIGRKSFILGMNTVILREPQKTMLSQISLPYVSTVMHRQYSRTHSHNNKHQPSWNLDLEDKWLL